MTAHKVGEVYHAFCSKCISSIQNQPTPECPLCNLPIQTIDERPLNEEQQLSAFLKEVQKEKQIIEDRGKSLIASVQSREFRDGEQILHSGAILAKHRAQAALIAAEKGSFDWILPIIKDKTLKGDKTVIFQICLLAHQWPIVKELLNHGIPEEIREEALAFIVEFGDQSILQEFLNRRERKPSIYLDLAIEKAQQLGKIEHLKLLLNEVKISGQRCEQLVSLALKGPRRQSAKMVQILLRQNEISLYVRIKAMAESILKCRHTSAWELIPSIRK
ncbi:MAG: hypothetical protein COT85_01170 [Chlamydiae bacterium CG10_big_fil_rev_8_21_14_0_10_42_34]|nr:MAG: hypothetical protein COT85_01170 [Chlamydiae bacterium CG10_big_fil_rev_8_21_14_0_10_42_34]